MNYELEHILFLVQQSKPTNVNHVQQVIEDYFNTIGWSILKEEYRVSMTEVERKLFLEKILKDVIEGKVQ